MNKLTLLAISEDEMFELSFQAILILVVGMVLWRVMAVISKRKSKSTRSSYFDTKYTKKWKKK
jgi:hypothetical protein